MGFYMCCDGVNEYYNLFVIDMIFGFLFGYLVFYYINFGVEDIDELMVGINFMICKGW